MKILKFSLEKSYLIKLDKYKDKRGLFFEMFKKSTFNKFIKYNFVQDNISFSKKNTLRGLHYQFKKPQGHLVTVLQGKIYDVGLDLRKKSKTFGEYAAIELSEKNNISVFWPPGVAHGFFAIGNKNIINYKCTGYYYSMFEIGVKYNDPDLKIKWPIKKNNVNISIRDQKNFDFKTIKKLYLPKL